MKFENKLYIVVASSLLLLITMIYQGVYAYFEAEVINAGVRNTTVATKTLSDLQIIDGTTTSSNLMIPGESITQTFQVKNNNDIKLCFNLNWESVVNTFVNTSDLHVSLSDGTNNIPLTLNTFPTTSTTLAQNMKINASTTNNYILSVEYVETEADQTGDMGKKFSGRITGEIVNCSGPEESLKVLAKLNSNYTYTENSNKCLQVDENGMILNSNIAMSDEETPIICTMEDDYGTSYYLRGNHQDNNVKFANMCWKLIRITGTGGYKLIYNGDLDANGKCTTTSGEHFGFEGQTLSLSGNKVYGTSYTKEGTTYTLSDTSTLNWTNDSASIIGKYTCGNTNTSCSTLYVVTGEYSSSEGYALKLDQSTNYAQIGTSAFNSSYTSPSYVGYMYNDTYPARGKGLSSNTNNYYYGESFTYNNGTYTLNNTVQFADVSDSTNKTSLNTHHYTCFNATDATCAEMYYIYYLNTNGKTLYYIKLNGSETGPEALNKMVNNNDINVKNSHIKGAIDWWYEQNIKNTEYESKLEDTVFCNDRTIDDLGGWSETGMVTETPWLKFNAYDGKYYLKCPNKRDAFTVSDSVTGNGALTYPVGLLTTTEHSLTGNRTANKTGDNYWASAPNSFNRSDANERRVSSGGNWNTVSNVDAAGGARPAVSLRPGITFKSGTDGSTGNPFEVLME